MTPPKQPERKCTGCKEMKHKKELMRVVKTAHNAFNIDESLKQDGRGAYLCKNITCFELAQKSKGFERSFKSKMPNDLYEQLYQKIKNENGGG